MIRTQDDINKLKAVTLYILSKCGETDMIHLFKILYFAEKEHYAVYGSHITQDDFYALEHGPVPTFLYDAIKLALQINHGSTLADTSRFKDIASVVKPGNADAYFFLQGTEQPDMDELSPAEIESLDKSIAENSQKPSKDLSEESHDEAWLSTQHNGKMSPYIIAKAGGASDEYIDYMKEQDHINAVLAEG